MAALTTLGVAFPLALPAHAVVSTAGSAPVAMFAVVPDGSSMKVVRFEASDAFAAHSLEAQGAARGEVVSVDSAVHSLGTTDPLRPQQWALDAVDFGNAWATTRGAGVTVAVVDSGVLGNHEDLAGSVLQGTDLVGSGNGWNDELGHGTHVAGVIAAHVSNGLGIIGAAPSVKILPVRVLDGGGSGQSSDVAEGIIYAADHRARVINLSLGGTNADAGTRTAIQYAVSKGSVVLAAAGNSGQSGSPRIYPGAFPEVVAVGAVDVHSQRAAFSNVGDYVDVVAPGVDVLSTYNASDPLVRVGLRHVDGHAVRIGRGRAHRRRRPDPRRRERAAPDGDHGSRPRTGGSRLELRIRPHLAPR